MLLALAWLLLAALTTARAQEPTPEPTPDFFAGFCENASIEGGGTRILSAVEITLPPGTYNIILPPPDPGEPNFVLCHKESGGVLNMNAANCQENSRVTPNAQAEAVIDAIAASCHLAPTPTPEPTPQFGCPAGDTFEGGQRVTIAEAIEVDLPPGEFIIDVDDADVAQICNPEAQYLVSLRLADCSTPAIAPPDDPNAAVKAKIRASCTALNPTSVPQPVTLIQPPNTGSAGLLTR